MLQISAALWANRNMLADSKKVVGSEARPSFLVSSFNLGTVDQVPPTAEIVAESLTGSEWCTAKVVASRGEWNQVPPGVAPEQWISVVSVGFGKQAEAYIFQFNRADGGARLRAHFPHRKRISNGAERWFQPAPQLCAALHSELNGRREDSGVPLTLEVVEEPSLGGANGEGFDEALLLPARTVLPPLKAIITAAACSQGWIPMSQPSPNRAKIEVRVHDRACSFRLTMESEGKNRVFSKDRVPWEEFQDQLSVLFRMPNLGPRVVDFARPYNSEVELLESEGNRTFFFNEGELSAIDTNGQEVWRLHSLKGKGPAGSKPRKPDFFAARRDDSGKLRLFAWGSALAEISQTDGTVTVLAPDTPAGATPTFDVDTAGHAVLARDRRVTLFLGGKEKWSVDEHCAVLCGPRLEGDRVLFGTDRGELIALALSDGRVLWRVQVGEQLRGDISSMAGLRFVFSGRQEMLFAVDPQDGSVRWRFKAGDAMVRAPFLFEGMLAVATKNNRVSLVRPETGSVEVQTQLDSWLVDARLVTVGRSVAIATSEASGRVALWDRNLNRLWESSTCARSMGRLVVARLRPQWRTQKKAAKGSTDEILEILSDESEGLLPFILTSDAKGFLFKMSLHDFTP